MSNIYQSVQGNMGLGRAIEYFTSNNITIALPLNDTQKYDLIADFNGKLQRISIKTSRFTQNNKSYFVALKNSGGASGKGVIRKFDNDSCDYVFIYTGDNNMYLIPAKDIVATNAICVGNKYTEYLVKSRTLKDFKEEVEL